MRALLHRAVNAIRRMLPWRINNLRFAFAAPLAYPLGHFYSPICATRSAFYTDPDTSPLPDAIPGIALDRERMAKAWKSWLPFTTDCVLLCGTKIRYNSVNSYFGLGEAFVLHALLRQLQPRQLVEIGCGFSSAAALDTIESHLGGRVACTFVDPYPERLQSLLRATDHERVTVIPKPVQTTQLAIFEALEENDILFIDTSHVLKTGSDVAFELFEILPRLKSGVHIHFQDIHYPFEYPKAWVEDLNYSWNETYALRAFLQYNSAFEVVFFNDYFRRLSHEHSGNAHEEIIRTLGSGLWLRRL